MAMEHHILTFYPGKEVRVRSSQHELKAVTLTKDSHVVDSVADLKSLPMERLRILHAHVVDGKPDAPFVSIEDTWERLRAICAPAAPRAPVDPAMLAPDPESGPKPPQEIARAPRASKGKHRDAIAALLLRPEGCTTADILAITGWPSVSVPAQAQSAGLVLRKEKVDGVTRYWGKRE